MTDRHQGFGRPSVRCPKRPLLRPPAARQDTGRASARVGHEGIAPVTLAQARSATRPDRRTDSDSLMLTDLGNG